MPATWISCFESVLWAEFHDTDDSDGEAIVASNIPAHKSSCVMHLH